MGKYLVAGGIFLLWVAWLFLLIFGAEYGLFFSEADNTNYARSGAFGDSFGVIASLMTTIAAVGVYMTFSSEVKARRRQDFENNFFTLLGNLESISSQLALERTRRDDEGSFRASYGKLQRMGRAKVVRTHRGPQAMTVILYVLRDKLEPSGYRDIKTVARAYQQTFDKYVGILGRYFRSLYHIYRLIDDSIDIDKMYYARIVRAQLGNTTLCLLGYNLIVGEGRFKFKKLAQKYSILHNLHREGLDEWASAELEFFLRKLHPHTFRFDPIAPVTYDD
jgi:hypothetical protein